MNVHGHVRTGLDKLELRGVGCGSVSDRSAIARHEASFYKLVEWSEQLRSVTSAWLGAVRRSVQVRLCTSGCKSEKMFGNISPPCDLLPSIIKIKIKKIKKNNNNNNNNNNYYYHYSYCYYN